MRFVLGVLLTMLPLACSGFSSSTEIGLDAALDAASEAGADLASDAASEAGTDAAALLARLDGGAAVCPDGGTCKHVFVSAKFYPAKMISGAKIGTAAADELCGLEAVAAGFGGTWVAWISDKESVAAINRVGRSEFYLVDGTLALSTSSGDPAFAHPINLSPFGEPLPNELVWTSTSVDGRARDDVASSVSCSFWTSVLANETGVVGTTSPKSLDTQEWTVSGLLHCDQTARLYCFQTSL